MQPEAPPPRGVFVIGTDTDIGKTTVSALLLAALASARVPARYFKPVQTGADSDTDTVARLAGLPAAELVPPGSHLPLPASPHKAAAAAGVTLAIPALLAGWRALAINGAVSILEGAGGLLVPLNERETLRDLVRATGLPGLLVASTRLGTINHVLLTVEAARAGGCPLAGLVLNGPPDPGLAETLTSRTGLPLVAEVPRLPDLTPASVGRVAPTLFPAAALCRLFPDLQPELAA